MASEQAAKIGARLRARREELGLTRRHLAHQMDGLATENDLYRWESGKHRPQDDTLSAIAKALGRDYAWAMGLSTERAETPDLFAVPQDATQLDRIEAKLNAIYSVIEQIGAEQLTALLQAAASRTEPPVAATHPKQAA